MGQRFSVGAGAAGDELIGRAIRGRYKLIDELARGSFGTVYVARDLPTNYLYAVKVLHFNFRSNTEIVTRFQREAHLPLSINDPHIVRVIDYGNDNNLYFIVMDYIDGQSLKYVMQNSGQMEAPRALNYAQQIAAGLDAAYKQGVVHRDLKPQNIIVNNKGEVKITDFGLARSQEMPTITESDEFMGTAYYISPEQIDSGHSADTRSDLYSVAAVLFEMLAGQPVFEGETVMDIVIKHKNAGVPSICRLRPDLPADMDLFFQKTLAKSPQYRYQTPQEFLAGLQLLQQFFQPSPSIAIQPAYQQPPLPVTAPPVYPRPSGPMPTPSPYQQPFDAIPQQGKSADAESSTIARKFPRLVAVGSGETFPLTREVMNIGRQDPTQKIFPDISLGDKMVGRYHARVRTREGVITVEDLNSRNKTRINGDILPPNQEHPLNAGDILRVGNVELRLERP